MRSSEDRTLSPVTQITELLDRLFDLETEKRVRFVGIWNDFFTLRASESVEQREARLRAGFEDVVAREENPGEVGRDHVLPRPSPEEIDQRLLDLDEAFMDLRDDEQRQVIHLACRFDDPALASFAPDARHQMLRDALAIWCTSDRRPS